MARRKKRRTTRKRTTSKRKKATRKKRSTSKRRTAKKRTTRKKRRTAKARRRTTAKGRKRRTAKAKRGKGRRRKANAAFMAPMKPSPALAAVIGPKAIPRTQVVKKLWQYIKRRKLQDPKNRRNIRADAKLAKVFKGKKVVSMFQMTKLVSKQLKKAA